MTIPFRSDKIAPVADDGDSTPQKIKPAGDAEAEQPGAGERKKGAGSVEKTDEKTVDNALQM